ncbi:MAG TPA: hypothetical protein VFX49_06160, partial [Chloroflexota bacterium]|nr:hypothetical protein [Chloroflexota bacterium]
MRRFSLPAAVVALAVSVTAADAGGGLPALAGLDVGPYRATLHNDSPWLRRGANTLTIEIPALPSGEHVALWLRGPLGQLVNVPLQPVRVLGATGRTGAGAGDSGDSGHGESDHAGGEHSGAAGQGSGTP